MVHDSVMYKLSSTNQSKSIFLFNFTTYIHSTVHTSHIVNKHGARTNLQSHPNLGFVLISSSLLSSFLIFTLGFISMCCKCSAWKNGTIALSTPNIASSISFPLPSGSSGHNTLTSHDGLHSARAPLVRLLHHKL
jgi:hypothetical protein